MNNDFRIKVGTLNNIKIRRLIGQYGSESFVGLVRLWDYAASTETPDGLLLGLTSSDIALIAEVKGDTFGDTLESLGLLDSVEGGYAIHNWTKHNSWCCESKNRSEHARKAVNKRWKNDRKTKS